MMNLSHQQAAEAVSEYVNAAAKSVFASSLPDVAEFVSARQKAGGLGDNTYPVKLLELAYILQQVQPKTVLEIGSGATSLLLCKAHRYACLEEKQWGGTAERLLENGRVCYRQTIPAAISLLVDGGSLDLLYVDGPNNENPEGLQYICTDARDLVEKGICPRHILVDLRCTSVKDMWPVLKEAGYRASPSTWTAHLFGRPWFIAPLKQHTWFHLP